MEAETSGGPARSLDLRGLKCPLPALYARRMLARLPAGATLEIEADDPLAGLDIPNLVRETGDRLMAAGEARGSWRFVIVKR